MNESIRVLIVEDTPTDAELAMREIRKALPGSEFQRVETESTFLDALGTFNPDLILSDYQMPHFNGMEALKLATKHVPQTPLIIYTGSINEDVAVECMKAGAYNYIIKENIKRLGSAVVHALEEKKIRAERQHNVDALRMSEARFSTVFHASPMAIAIARLKNNQLIDVNEKWQELTGFSREEAIGHKSAELGGLFDKSIREEIKEKLITQGAVRGVEFQIRKKSGEAAYLLFSAEIAEIEGEPCILSMALDITERKHAQETLLKNQQILHEAQHMAKLGSWTADLQTGSFDIGPEGGSLVGWEPGSRNLAALMDLVHPEDIGLVMHAWETAIQQGIPFDFQYRILANGELKWLHTKTKVISDKEGKPVSVLGVTQDITERRQSEEALRELERFARATVDALSANLAILDETGTIIAVNRAWREFSEENKARDTNTNSYLGINYLSVCESAYGNNSAEASAMARGLRAVMSGKQKEFLLEYPCHSPTQKRWFVARVTRFPGEGDLRIVVAHENITALRQMEEALRESETRLSTVFRVSPISIAITRLKDNRIIDVNEAWQAMTGFKKEEVLSRSTTEFNIWADPAERGRLVNLLQENGIVQNFEFQLKHQSGTIRSILMSADLIELSGEQCMLTMALDITERKKTEEALHASEERFQALVQNSADLIAVINRTGAIQYASPTSERILGYVPVEVIGRNFLEWVHPEDVSIAIESLASRSAEPGTARQSIEVRGLHKDGTWRIIEVLGTNLLGDPVINGIVLNMRDITERKKSEAALFQAEERFHKAFFSGPVGLAITNASSGIYIEANDAFSIITGFSREELLNHTSLELKITTREQRNEYQHVMKEQGFVRNKEMKLRHKSGDARVVLGSMEIIELNHETCVLSTAIDISERNQAIMALQESEEKYRALFQNAQVGMFRTKLDDSALLAVNPKFCEVLGYSEEELLSKPSTMLWADPHARKQMTAELKTKKTIQEYEIEMRTKGGDLRTCLISAQFMPGEDYMEGSLLDITSRKQAEDWISRLNRQLELILNSAGEGIYGMDSEGRITFINPAMARMIGWDIADLLSHSMHEICHHSRPDGQPFPKEECPIINAYKDGTARHSELDFYWRKDGTIFPVEYTSTPIRESGKLVGTVVLVSDITKRLQAEGETRQHVTEMEMLYESGLALSQLMTPKEIGQKIIELLEQKMDWHHTAIRLYHPEQDDLLQLLAFSQPGMQTLEEASVVEKHFQTQISKLGEGLSGWAVQNSQIVRSGNVGNDPRYRETYPGLHSGLYVPMKLGNEVLGVISIESEQPNAFNEADERLVATLANQAAVAFENASLYQTAQQEIIERRRIEQLLAEERNQLALRVEERTADLSHANMDLERALRVKDEFLASMSHELRTPLTGILGFSEALQLMAYGELSERQLKTIKSIEDSGRHLLELINDILDLSKIEAGKLELQFAVCSVTDICQSSLMLIKGMANQKRQMIDYSPSAEPIAIYADSRRIKQILVNLLSNAVKFTPENGELGLEIETIPSEQKIKLCVWDKGIGIKPADMEKLFRPFTQIDSSLAREYSGTGLGLSLANRLAELHNGAIQVESSPGAGSRFTVTLPWSPQEAIQSPVTYETSGEANPETPEAIMSSLIMIADDNETVLEMLAEFLETIRFRVARVHSGAELLEKAGETLPDIMLVDIQMPGMDGLETIRRIRKHKNPLVATTTVIAVTALAMPGDRERCLQAGANEYISKPVKLQELSELIQKLIKR